MAMQERCGAGFHSIRELWLEVDQRQAEGPLWLTERERRCEKVDFEAGRLKMGESGELGDDSSGVIDGEGNFMTDGM